MKKKIFRIRKTLFLILGIIVLFFLIFFLQKKGFFFEKTVINIERFFHQEGKKFSENIRKPFSFRKLSQENEKLKEENERLIQENVKLKIFEKENKTLKEHLNFLEKENYSMIFARVLALENNSQDTILIDRGEKDGIEKEMPVVKDQILLGKVSEIFPNTSKVILVTNPNFKIDGKILGKNIDGIIKKNYEDLEENLKMELIPQQEKIEKDEIVVTLGLEKKIPPGLIIGKIESVEKDPSNQLFQKAIIKPLFEKKDLDIVGIIKIKN
ncbi:MAG: rod shape-determining protein MreC [Patescibacteria group bacterium]